MALKIKRLGTISGKCLDVAGNCRLRTTAGYYWLLDSSRFPTSAGRWANLTCAVKENE